MSGAGYMLVGKGVREVDERESREEDKWRGDYAQEDDRGDYAHEDDRGDYAHEDNRGDYAHENRENDKEGTTVHKSNG